MDLELVEIKGGSYNNNDAENGDIAGVEVGTGNGACVSDGAANATEDDTLLESTEVAGGGNNREEQSESGLCRLKRELNEDVCGLKVWMIFLIILIIIAIVILLSLCFCLVSHEDADEVYDASTFTVARVFRGNFTLSSQIFTTDPSSLPSQDDIVQKLTDIFKSSHALGQYFSDATVLEMRHADVEYGLRFLMPEEHEELVKYILSREVVYNVLRQNLLDQEPQDRFYINDSSLSLTVGN